jgi:hypothetical protein
MKVLTSVFIAICLCFVGFNAYGVDVPEKVTIKAAQAKQAPVTFSHGKHATTIAKTCETCHHTDKGLTAKSTTKVATCTSCHLDPKDAKVPGMREMALAKNPFHIRCVGCHNVEKKGPTCCPACHDKA